MTVTCLLEEFLNVHLLQPIYHPTTSHQFLPFLEMPIMPLLITDQRLGYPPPPQEQATSPPILIYTTLSLQFLVLLPRASSRSILYFRLGIMVYLHRCLRLVHRILRVEHRSVVGRRRCLHGQSSDHNHDVSLDGGLSRFLSIYFVIQQISQMI